MKFKDWWKRKPYWLRGGLIGAAIAIIFSFLPGILFMAIPSIMKGRLVCSTLGGEVGCGNFLGFLLLYIAYTVWLLVIVLLPSIVIGAIVGFILSKFKRKR